MKVKRKLTCTCCGGKFDCLMNNDSAGYRGVCVDCFEKADAIAMLRGGWPIGRDFEKIKRAMGKAE